MFSGGLRKTIFFLQECISAVQGNPRSLVFVPTANQMRLCDFLFVHHSNLGPILHRFRDIAGFLLPALPVFQPNFGGKFIPVGPDR